jgi:Asp-tRNA(Asn)/Glu-tRNA(Gln) amidotransferase A subunit family amidase
VIAVSRKATSDVTVHPDCITALEAAAHLLEDLGHEVVEADPPIDMDRFHEDFWALLAANTAADLIELEQGFGRPMSGQDLEPWTLGLAARAARQDVGAFALAFRNLWRLHRPMGAFLTQYDALLTPTLATPPAPLGWMDPGMNDTDELMARIRAFMPFTPLANAFGHPAISLPLHWNSAGLPVGVMLQTALGGEGRLLRLAAQLETARPWAHRRPPIWG